MGQFFSEIAQIWKHKEMVSELAKADFKKRIAGSYFGMVWMFVQPVVTIVIYYLVFTLLRDGRNDRYPFILWLVAGLVPWFFFSEALQLATNSLYEYSYLVKKVVFNISVLPVIKVVSALFIHLIFLLIMVLFYGIMGYFPTAYWLQIPYYSLAMLVLVLAVGYLCASIYVFFKDMAQIVSIILQFGIWVTPIMWNYIEVGIGGTALALLKLNPMFYIVQGYRDSLLDQVWFWQRPGETLYFWVFALLFLFAGVSVFQRLRPHFADVL